MDNLAGKTVLQATFLFVVLSHFYLVKTSKTNIKKWAFYYLTDVCSVFKYWLKPDVILKAHCYAAKMSSEKRKQSGPGFTSMLISDSFLCILLSIGLSRMK